MQIFTKIFVCVEPSVIGCCQLSFVVVLNLPNAIDNMRIRPIISEMSNSELSNSGLGNSGLGDSELGNNELGDSELGNSGLGNIELGNSGLGNSGLGNSELGNNGLGNSGLGNSELGNSISFRSSQDISFSFLLLILMVFVCFANYHLKEIDF